MGQESFQGPKTDPAEIELEKSQPEPELSETESETSSSLGGAPGERSWGFLRTLRSLRCYLMYLVELLLACICRKTGGPEGVHEMVKGNEPREVQESVQDKEGPEKVYDHSSAVTTNIVQEVSTEREGPERIQKMANVSGQGCHRTAYARGLARNKKGVVKRVKFMIDPGNVTQAGIAMSESFQKKMGIKLSK